MSAPYTYIAPFRRSKNGESLEVKFQKNRLSVSNAWDEDEEGGEEEG